MNAGVASQKTKKNTQEGIYSKELRNQNGEHLVYLF